MKRLFDLSLGQRLAIGFGFAGALLVAIAALSLGLVEDTSRQRYRLTQVLAPRAEAAVRLENSVFATGLAARNAVLLPGPERQQAFASARRELYANLESLLALPKDEDSPGARSELTPLVSRFAEHAEALASAVASTDPAGLETLERGLTTEREELHARLAAYAALQAQRVDESRRIITEALQRMSDALIAASAALLALLALVGALVSRSVRRPAARLVGASRSLGSGDFGPALALWSPVHDEGPQRDEMAELTRSFARMAHELQAREERLRVQHEQIQAQHEELQAQHEQLQAQNEELHSQNEELAAQGEELSSQRDELRRSVVALEASEERLRDSDVQKNEFLAILSHELRNPLSPIRNCLHLLERVPPGSAAAVHALEIIDRQVGHLTRLVDDLLDLARVSRGKIRLQPAPLELGRLLRETAEDTAALFSTRGVELQVETPAEPIAVEGDAARLTQVIGNLLQNAAKFTPKGGHVSLRLEVDGRLARLRVRDTGAGMDAETLGKLFQPFMQAQATLARTDGGLGLGLALVKRLVELHSGTVRASSEGHDRGSEFVVELPRRELGTIEAVRSPTAKVTRRRVLVVEDNVDAADSLRDALVLAGHEVEVAYGGLDGIRRAHDWRPDVVLCDLGLPDVDGHEVARRLTADPTLAAVYLVALSGYAQPEDQRRAVEAGFRQHLAKPASFERLAEVLAHVPDPPRGDLIN